MSSAFGWLDADGAHRRKMLEVVDLFREQGTVDELGFGSIRDALSDLMFPGTSTLHTRLRYVLFIPWLLQQAANTRTTPEDMAIEFQRLEYRLIPSLMNGGEQQGVFGNRARARLQRLPSAAYWGAMTTWGVFDANLSSQAYFRREHDNRELAARTPRTDDPESRVAAARSGIDPGLPAPPPDLLRATSFTLTASEEEYLSDAIVVRTKGSLLAWLVRNPPRQQVEFVWELDNLAAAPAPLRELVDHARRFQEVAHGANLLYNLMLARRASNEERAAQYADLLDAWSGAEAVVGWDRTAWWALIAQQNPRLAGPTRDFVDHWIELLATRPVLTRSAVAEAMIVTRERGIKGGRARLVNQAALDAWSGASGVGRLGYRWTYAQSHLNDLYQARGAL